jgi:hypothetical protein
VERNQNSVVHRRQRYRVQTPRLLAKSRPTGSTPALGHCEQTRSASVGIGSGSDGVEDAPTNHSKRPAERLARWT